VDGDEEHAPDSVEIQNLDNTTDSPIVEAKTVEQEAEPVEPAEQEAAPVESAEHEAAPVEPAFCVFAKSNLLVAANEDGHEAANEDGNETAEDDGDEAADDWIEVHSKKHLRGKRTLPLILSANGTGILRGHSKGRLPSNGGFPVAKFANHAHVWLNKSAILLEKNGTASMVMDPGKPSNNGFYTTKVRPGDSILRIRKVKPIGVPAKRVQFTDSESNTRKVKPSKRRVARKSLVPPSVWYHRSVLGAVAPRT
jgi:hypothetical protein